MQSKVPFDISKRSDLRWTIFLGRLSVDLSACHSMDLGTRFWISLPGQLPSNFLKCWKRHFLKPLHTLSLRTRDCVYLQRRKLRLSDQYIISSTTSAISQFYLDRIPLESVFRICVVIEFILKQPIYLCQSKIQTPGSTPKPETCPIFFPFFTVNFFLWARHGSSEEIHHCDRPLRTPTPRLWPIPS